MRCAIYTRKSTEEGLAQEFNSLDAQRESGEAYILSRRQAGGSLWPSGTTMVDTRARTWNGLPCDDCKPISQDGRENPRHEYIKCESKFRF
jgi:hypothetical protein